MAKTSSKKNSMLGKLILGLTLLVVFVYCAVRVYRKAKNLLNPLGELVEAEVSSMRAGAAELHADLKSATAFVTGRGILTWFARVLRAVAERVDGNVPPQ